MGQSRLKVVSVILFLVGLPIAYYAAKHNVDIDLLTRGAGFGYIGSTITSLIYASFTFIFFALEAVVMAGAGALFPATAAAGLCRLFAGDYSAGVFWCDADQPTSSLDPAALATVYTQVQPERFSIQ